MIYSEDYKAAQEQEKALYSKWGKVLNAFGGISNEHMARTTAILLENYINHVNSDVRLIAEDKIGASAFTGVNLALINLIRRAIPELVGAELAGVQAMPTPNSPIFTLKWKRDNTKGSVTAGQEMWNPDTSLQEDPYYSSSQVKFTSFSAAELDAGASKALTWALTGNNGSPVNTTDFPIVILNNSMVVTVKDSDGEVVQTAYFASSNNYTTATFTHVSGTNYFNGAGATATWTLAGRLVDLQLETAAQGNGLTATVEFEYVAESQPNVPELSLEVTRTNVHLIRRQLRGRFSVDAAYDAKVLNGLVLENELMEMMKIELMNGINREIVDDLRALAGSVFTIDVQSVPVSAHNYDDISKYILDGISRASAIIWTRGRLGYGNFVVGNPITLAFLDRVPGFVGSGVNADGKGLTFAGSLGGKIKFYKDPQYPENELLVGYKGGSTLDTGYMHCPYLPITAMPTMHDQLTGDPIKHFYTRYGKTFRAFDPDTQTRVQAIVNAHNQYIRIKVANLPAIFA